MRQTAQSLLRSAYSVSPLVAIDSTAKDAGGLFGACLFAKDPPHYLGINIDISGCERLFRSRETAQTPERKNGEQNIICRLTKDFRAQGFDSRIAVSPTLGGSWALSRFGFLGQARGESWIAPAQIVSGQIISRRELKAALADLPPRALRLSRPTLECLEELNITRIEQLLALPRKSLPERFGPELLLRLDQALGIAQEVITPAEVSLQLREEIHFASPVATREQLLRAADSLLEKLLAKLVLEMKKPGQLILEIGFTARVTERVELVFSQPSANKRHIWNLLRPRLEQLELATRYNSAAAIERLSLLATRVEEISQEQVNSLQLPIEANLSSAVADPVVTSRATTTKALSARADFNQLLDLLHQGLGRQAVCRVETRESHIPEHSFYYPPLATKKGNLEKKPRAKKLSVTAAERPSVLFLRPQPMQALSLLPDGPPARLSWRGKTHNICRGIGPERIAPAWWGEDSDLCLSRDYFRVQLPCGTWLWVFRQLAAQASGEWYVHGIWA